MFLCFPYHFRFIQKVESSEHQSRIKEKGENRGERGEKRVWRQGLVGCQYGTGKKEKGTPFWVGEFKRLLASLSFLGKAEVGCVRKVRWYETPPPFCLLLAAPVSSFP